MKIQANYDEIRLSSSALKQKASSYESCIQRISARINDLSGIWQGTDSQAFIARMESVKPQLLQMKEVTESYARLLDQAANAYQTLQSARAASARNL